MKRCKKLQPISNLSFNSDKKKLKTLLNEFIQLLTFEVDDNVNNNQLILEDIYYDYLIKLGLINNLDENNISLLKDFFNKEMDFEFQSFINLLSMFIEKKPETEPIDESILKYCVNYRLNKVAEQESSNNPMLIDLFSGAGGMSLGFKQAGFDIALANDIEESCLETYRFNHPEVPDENVIQDDIEKILGYVKDLLPNKEIDIVIGGPPCQGFSNANRQRLIDDPRNELYKHFVSFVDLIKPNFFVMENVRGMNVIAHQVIEDFNALGYNVHCEILNASDFGVPQNRERLIFIGNLVGLDSESIFEEIHKENENIDKFVLKDALFGLKQLKASNKKNATTIDSEEFGSKIDLNHHYNRENEYIRFINNGRNSKYIFNHKARYNNERDIEIFGRLHQGDQSDDPKIADIMPYKHRNHIFKDKYYKLRNHSYCKTITAHMKFDCNMYIHPTQARGLTPREAARVQSFPDDYFFKGAYTKTYMQIGNSVPPLMGRGIGKVLKKVITNIE